MVESARDHSAAESLPPGRWLHRWSIVIVGLVWPLIWVGGQVTTYDAGMAVPDWPGTYGYNLLLYPYQTWLLGPFDLFIEHGHRLLGALVGLVSIVAVGFAFFSEPRRWVRWLSVLVLLAVIGQGLLGGARVVLADRTLAMLHGCTAEIFFSLCVGLMVVTSRWWWERDGSEPESSGRRDFRPGAGLMTVSLAVCGLAYLQVVLGAQLRHVQPTAAPGGFTHLVMTHISTAFVILALAAWLAWRLSRAAGQNGERSAGCGDLTLSRPASLLLIFVLWQILLGSVTWVARYGIPWWAQVGPRSASYLVKSQAFAESLMITGHVATGALVLVTSVFLMLRLWRVRFAANQAIERAGSAAVVL